MPSAVTTRPRAALAGSPGGPSRHGRDIPGSPGARPPRPRALRPDRNVPSSPAPHRYSKLSTALEVLRSPLFWLLVALFDGNERDPHQVGRPSAHPAYVKVLVMVIRTDCASMAETLTELGDPLVWRMVKRACNKYRRQGFGPCGDQVPSPSQMKAFHASLKLRFPKLAEILREESSRAVIERIQELGLLDPAAPLAGKTPDPRNYVATDGTVMAPAFGRGKDESCCKQIRFNDPWERHRIYGSKVQTTSLRVSVPGVRFILDARMVEPGPNGAPGNELPAISAAIEGIDRLSGGGLRGLIVDSVVRGTFVTELARRGIVAVCHPHAAANPNRQQGGRMSKGRRERSHEYVPAKHHVRGIGICQHDLVNIGTVMHTRVTDDTGAETLVPLTLAKSYTRANRRGTYRQYHDYAVPCVHGEFTHRHAPFAQDGKGINYGEFERFYPVGSEAFTTLYGRRNDTESWHAQAKRRGRGRMPAKDANLQNIYLILGALRENILAFDRLERAGITSAAQLSP